jgi:hypothetical protein
VMLMVAERVWKHTSPPGVRSASLQPAR